MAKESSKSSPLLIAAFQPNPLKVPKDAPKKVRRGEPKPGAAPAAGYGQHGELAGASDYPPPKGHIEKMKEQAEEEKRTATRNWIAGRIPTAEHDEIHSRANHVLRKGLREGLGKGAPKGAAKSKKPAGMGAR
jgi:hypothetical protein